MTVFEKISSLFKREHLVADLIFDMEKKITKASSKNLKTDLWLYKKCFSLLMSSIRLSRTTLENNQAEKLLFQEVFVRLSVKIMNNGEAMHQLIQKGLYGSCFVLMRTLIFDVHMIWYLYLNPELIEPWLSENFMSYKNRDWSEQFKEKTIIKNLEEKGKPYNLSISETTFSLYSKAGHPCFFSIRFFQNQNGVLAYVPDFQFQTAQWMLWNIVGLLLYPTQIYLLHNKDDKTDELKRLGEEYARLMGTANHFGLKVVDTHKNIYRARPLEEIKTT